MSKRAVECKSHRSQRSRQPDIRVSRWNVVLRSPKRRGEIDHAWLRFTLKRVAQSDRSRIGWITLNQLARAAMM